MQTVPERERQTRRRGHALDEAILDAAWEELSDRGWEGFTIEGVADRSGTAKSVIYRRWSDRVELAQALLARGRGTTPQILESAGDLRTDLLAFLQGMAHFLRGPFGDASRGIAIAGDPRKHPSVFDEAAVVAIVGDLVRQARGRGDLAGKPSPLALNVGHTVVMWEFTHTRQAPSDEHLAELVDAVWLPALRHSAG